jgi:hypothetical protein
MTTQSIVAYFDDLTVNNLFHKVKNFNAVANNIEVVTGQFKHHGFEIKSLDNVFSKGIYNISIGAAPSWYNINNNGTHVLAYIPNVVRRLARMGKLTIFLNSQAEGWPLSIDGVDGYKRLHAAMKKMGLPRYSVIIGDSNSHFDQDYRNWCCDNRELPMVKHCYFLTGFYYFENRIPAQPLYIDAIQNENAMDFNSLNRNIRMHRTEHLYYLVKNELHNKGIVSGQLPENYNINPIFNNITLNQLKEVLEPVSPLNADGPWYALNPDSDSTAIFNHTLYKNSLLSVVTESAYYQPGMFITEKVFKPIVAGHPFMILGQTGILKELRKMGYRTDFHGIDQSYDEIADPIVRFKRFHLSLEKWIKLSREEKITAILKSKDAIEHNFNFYKTKDYIQDSFNRLKWTFLTLKQEKQ